MEISYKCAEQKDIEPIYQLCKNMVDAYENLENIDYKAVMHWIRQKIESHIESYKAIYFHEGKVGYIYLHEVDGKLEIDDFYIFEQYRCKGIGTIVLQDCIKQSELLGCSLFLYVFSKNIGAVSLYHRNGFVITQQIHNSRYIMERKVEF